MTWYYSDQSGWKQSDFCFNFPQHLLLQCVQLFLCLLFEMWWLLSQNQQEKLKRRERKRKQKRKEKHERVSVAPPDGPSQAIHYSLNASQCQLYYCKAVPDWRPRVGGEKWQQNTAGCPGRKQGRGCDGWVCLTQAGWKAEMGLFQMRHEVGKDPAPLPRASQPCQDERRLAKLLPSVLLSLVSKQTHSIFNR